MEGLETLVKEMQLLRSELEDLKKTVSERSFLPVFYRRAILVLLVCSTISVAVAVYNTFQAQRLFSLLSDWSLYEIGNVEE